MSTIFLTDLRASSWRVLAKSIVLIFLIGFIGFSGKTGLVKVTGLLMVKGFTLHHVDYFTDSALTCQAISLYIIAFCPGFFPLDGLTPSRAIEKKSTQSQNQNGVYFILIERSAP